MKLLSTIVLLLVVSMMYAQDIDIDKIEPPYWWVGMKTNKIELLVHGKNLALCTVALAKDAPARLGKVEKAESPNYLMVELTINGGAKPGNISLNFTRPGATKEIKYEIKERNKDPNRVRGVDASDFIYLLMPDRFSNGDPSNDNVAEMKQPKAKRDTLYGRHGGDIKGVMNHLDYIKALGATAIWMNPEIENDQPFESYHGYATTDFYRIDRRLGTNELYQEYVNKCHQMGLKVIKDVVFNHIGNECWWYKDLPEKSWVHQFPEFTKTTYRASTLLDPYASTRDKNLMSDGWFDKHMPDLNQKNPHLANYLIQNSIWWVEMAGIDGYRIDTYAYPDLEFMNNWVDAVQKEYPNLSIFGETWVEGPAVQSYFVKNRLQTKEGGFFGLEEKDKSDTKLLNSKLPGVTDFQTYFALTKAFNEDFGWMNGVMQLYYTLAQDFLYQDATKNVVFLDNHDLGRYFSTVNEDVKKLKQATTFLLTTRGIPSLYYGTEVLMKNNFDWGNHDKVREEFPGGWADHPNNKFTEEGRSAQENEYFNYISKLANYRKAHTALQTGKLMQYVPEDGIYTYFRYNATENIMIIINSNKVEKKLNTARFEERLSGLTKGIDVMNDKILTKLNEIIVPANAALVIELSK